MANYSAQITAIADTYVDGLYSAFNFGTSQILKVQEVKRTLIGFDISSIPADKVITRIDLYFYVNGFTSDGTSSIAYDTSYNYVIRARRLSGYTNSELETSLNFNKLAKDATDGNIIRVNSTPYDSSLNITTYYGQWACMNIVDIERPENNEIIIGIRPDTNYAYDNPKMYACTPNILARNTNYAPYIIVYYSDPAPNPPHDLVPNETSRNKAGEIKLSWQNTSIQTSYTLQYSTNSNFSTYTSVNGGSSNTYTIPAYSFGEGNKIYWRVRITDNLNVQSDWSEIASFTIGATIPSIPIIVTPINTIVNSAREIYFRWRFVDDYGYSQAKFELQYKKQGEEENTVSASSESGTCILPGGTIKGGNYLWRVRCYNAFGEVSPFTEWINFYSIGKPETPVIIGVSNNMHPTITWSSPENDQFRIKIYSGANVIHDSGEQIITTGKEYTVRDFIENGTYKVGIQISNIYGLWSNEAFYNFTINTEKPVKPKLYGSNTEDIAASLIFDSLTSKNLLYRKSKYDKEFSLIATLDTNNFIDYTASHGSNDYFVRAVTEEGFSDSEIVTIDLEFFGIVLNDSNNPNTYINLWRTLNADKRKNISITKEQYLIQCNGRKFPISQSTEFRGHSENHEYCINYEEYEKANEVLDCQVLIYRNDKGYRYKVQIQSYNFNENETNKYILSFLMTRLEE